MIKKFEEFIQDREDEQINEGLISTIKSAIKNLTKTPDKYMDALKKQVEKSKNKQDYQFTVRMASDHKEEFLKELAALNDEETLEAIYKLSKRLIKSQDFVDFLYRKGEFRGSSYTDNNMRTFRKQIYSKIRQEFNIEEKCIKTYAIYEILISFAYQLCEEKGKKGTKEKSYSSSYSSSSSDVVRNTAMAAAIMMMTH